MKKILSLGIASAVLALTAMTASAGVVPTADNDAPKKGDTITVTFTTDSASPYVKFTAEATGATLVSSTSPLIIDGIPAEEQTTQLADGGKTFATAGAVAANTVVMVQTYTVDAEAGQPVTINITNPEGLTGNNGSLTIEVKAEGGNDNSNSSDTNSSDTNSSDTTSSDTNSSDTTSSQPDPSKPPQTGVALAVFPAIIAGAAVVVAKKRK